MFVLLSCNSSWRSSLVIDPFRLYESLFERNQMTMPSQKLTSAACPADPVASGQNSQALLLLFWGGGGWLQISTGRSNVVTTSSLSEEVKRVFLEQHTSMRLVN